MNYPLFFVLVSLILGFSLFIGWKSAKEHNRTDEDYFLGKRSFGLFRVAMTILATQLGGGAIIGTADAAYTYGWFAISYSLGIGLGLILLSLGIGAKFRRMEISTVPQIFERVYKSHFLYMFSSVLYIISMFLILVAIGVAARKFALSIGYNNEFMFIVFWLVIITYTAYGGLAAVTNTDMLQIIFVLGAFALTFMFLPTDLRIVDYVQDVKMNPDMPLLAWLVVPCLFTIIGQDMAQRCFAAKSPRIISYAAFIAAIFLVIATALPALLGVIASKLGHQAIKESSVLIDIVGSLTNPYVTSIFACSILMAILSTADSLLCAISSNVALDFKHILGKNRYKMITIIIGIFSMLLSFFAEDIIGTMIVAYSISICALFVPIIMSLVLKNPSKSAAILSALGGIFAFCTLQFFPELHMYREIIALTVSLLGFVAGSVFAKLALKA